MHFVYLLDLSTVQLGIFVGLASSLRLRLFLVHCLLVAFFSPPWHGLPESPGLSHRLRPGAHPKVPRHPTPGKRPLERYADVKKQRCVQGSLVFGYCAPLGTPSKSVALKRPWFLSTLLLSDHGP